MDDSAANLSTSMCDVDEQDLSSALLNNNVSFSSTMVTSSADLSFSLSEAEKCKLMQNIDVNCRPSEDMELSIPEKNSSVQEKPTLEEQATLDEETTLDEASTLEESESVINLEDTIDEVAPQATVPQIPQLVVNQPVEADEDEFVLAEEAMEIVEEPAAVEVVPPEYFKGKLIEVGRRCWKSSADAQHYTKGCYWSPDGTCLLVPIHLDGMHVMELPPDLYTATTVAQERSLTSLVPAVHVPEGGTVYDCVWYPHMNSQQPDTCFWLATRQHEPIHMWDAFDGKLRCSYSGYDAVDEVMAAISLAFSHDGQKVYAGYKRCIKIFDTSRPGRLCDDYPVKFAISCIAQTTEQPNTLTCGNWHGYIQHFDLRCSPKQGPLFTLGGHKAGITQLKYADGAAGWQLFSGARKCPKLLQWDMRNYKKPLAEYQRHVDTNQRIQFDLTPDLGWLASGDTQGALNVWDMNGDGEVSALPLHNDCCNGVSFHPTLPILASSSGQYHFIGTDGYGCKNDSVLDCTGAAEPELSREQPLEVIYENAVVMWWCG